MKMSELFLIASFIIIAFMKSAYANELPPLTHISHNDREQIRVQQPLFPVLKLKE